MNADGHPNAPARSIHIDARILARRATRTQRVYDAAAAGNVARFCFPRKDGDERVDVRLIGKKGLQDLGALPGATPSDSAQRGRYTQQLRERKDIMKSPPSF